MDKSSYYEVLHKTELEKYVPVVYSEAMNMALNK